MKPKVRNIYLYHTCNTFISMIFFPFLSKQTELFSLWSRTIPSFQICGTWQMSFIVSKPLGIIFVCCSSGGHNGNRIHTRPLSQISMNHLCDSSYMALLGWNHRKKMTGSRVQCNRPTALYPAIKFSFLCFSIFCLEVSQIY